MNVIITEITVGAATSFNHPHESYANFKPSLTLKATVEGSNADAFLAARDLQETAQRLVLAEKERILDAIEREHETEDAKNDVQRWKEVIKSYERLIATTDEELAKLQQEDDWNSRDRVRAITQAKEQIDNARQEYTNAENRLTALTSF